MLEPGRSIVGEAGTTIYKIGATKTRNKQIYAAVNGGMNDNIRPSLYQAKYCAVMANRMNEIANVDTKTAVSPEPSNDNNVLNNEEKILHIVKTNEPDIYDVYDNEDVLNKPKIGIALVQTMSDSKLLRNSFRDKNAITNIKFVCVFVEKFNKWRAIRPV